MSPRPDNGLQSVPQRRRITVAKRKSKPTYNGLVFDSGEEVEFYQWCEEALVAGVLLDFRCQYTTWPLAESAKLVKPRFGAKGQPLKPSTRTLLREVTYTADFTLWTQPGRLPLESVTPGIYYVDVKPAYERDQARQRKFSVLQKWVFSQYGRYVEPVVPIKWFKKTWCPDKARLSPVQQKVRSGYKDLPTLSDFLNTALT